MCGTKGISFKFLRPDSPAVEDHEPAIVNEDNLKTGFLTMAIYGEIINSISN